jgi:hypothetical protein
LTDEVKGRWEAVAENRRITGLNAFVATNVQLVRQGRPFNYDPADQSVVFPDSPNSLVATPLSRAMQLTISLPAPVAPPWGLMLWMSIIQQPTMTISELIYTLDASATQAVVTGLTPGILHYFAVNTFGFRNSRGDSALFTTATPLA